MKKYDTIEEENAVLDKLDVHKAGTSYDKIVFLGGSIVLGIIGVLCTNPFESIGWLTGFISGVILWISIYIAKGLYIIPAQSAVIIEQYGKFKRIATSGICILCFPPYIDTPIYRSINLKKEKLSIHSDTAENVEVDFDCGASAPVKSEIWFEIEDPILWHYRTSEPLEWFHDQVSAFLQPLLEKRSLDQARRHKVNIGKLYGSMIDDVEGGNAEPIHFHDSDSGEDMTFKEYVLRHIGVNWTALLIIDIEIPENIQRIREEELVSTLNKRKAEIGRGEISEQAKGYFGAIQGIREYASENDHKISFEDAETIFNTNKDREAFEKSGANITIIGDNIKNLIGSFLQGGNKQ